MTADFAIDVDPARDLVQVRMSGFFSPDDFARFVAAQVSAHGRLTCPPNRHATIIDVRDMKIQSQEIVHAFRELLAEPRYWARRLAFVVGPTLMRAQLRRAIGSRDAHCFADPAEAEAWATAPDADDAIAA